MKFNVGDLVRVCNKDHSDNVSWVNSMDKYLGNVGKISRVVGDWCEIEGFGSWGWDFRWLEHIKATEYGHIISCTGTSGGTVIGGWDTSANGLWSPPGNGYEGWRDGWAKMLMADFGVKIEVDGTIKDEASLKKYTSLTPKGMSKLSKLKDAIRGLDPAVRRRRDAGIEKEDGTPTEEGLDLALELLYKERLPEIDKYLAEIEKEEKKCKK